MFIVSSILLVSSVFAAPGHVGRRAPAPPNCLADVIVARGIENPSLERRASWSYEGETGVSHWGDFNTVCEKGEYQSPVNFEGDKFATSKKPSLNWTSLTKPFDFINNGHTIQLQLKESMPSLLSNQIDGLTYQVQQVHFHSPSEHHVDEKYYPLEAHFVHTSVDSKLNVIGLFFEIGPQDNPWIAQFVDTLPTSTTASTKLQGLDMSSIITAIAEADFFSYTGSLTTPPCTEGVLWLVARQPLKISQAQWDKLTKVMPFNSRTTQANKSGKNATESSHGNSNYTAVVTTAPAKVNVNSGATFLSAFTAFATLALLLL